MSGYEILELGAFGAWSDYVSGSGTKGKRFVDHDMTTQYIGVSTNAAAPGEGAPFWHAHSQLEELYIFLQGRGQMGLDDEVVDVEPGSVVRVGQGVWRIWRCAPDSPEDLRMLCVRAGGGVLAELPRDSERDMERPKPW
ncbi:MAG: hypothetical protein BGO95_09710 [Micrococcales bacterium 73-13]|nr:MAG: hypothetical protein BGO95_09710 [Micrococcales bacterium 73-13]